ncbi:nickel transporter [Streptomyces sp. NPDC102406]|uniref:nickel transporter n=1 Tax=Streptomyces sp. NPDC102406 TaxID=3366171 RepID=UPI00381DF0B6
MNRPAFLGAFRPRRAALGLLLALALLLVPAPAADAHPLGNFTTSTYDGLVTAPGRLRVTHVEDLAEIPATQAAPAIERAGKDGWARARCRDAVRAGRLSVDGAPTPVVLRASSAAYRPGQAGLRTLRVECEATAPLPRGRAVTLSFHVPDRPGPGWHEITARGDRTTLGRSDVPRASLSHRLTRYPRDLLGSPPHTTSATVRVVPGGPALRDDGPERPAATSVLPRGADRWTSALTGLVARHDLTPGFAALALATALALGALHALAPGHGKTLMAATAAARGRARPRDVLPLAASVTVTHTLGVVALGALVVGGSAAAPSVVAWLGVASGVLVTAAGVSLVRRAWRTGAHAHSHAHDHAHPHSPLGHGRHGHGRHGHERSGHERSGSQVRSALFLGFAGGLVPSPSAVVVLVGAAALGQAWFGVLLVVAYGAGLAVTLTAAGFVAVRAGAFAARRIAASRLRGRRAARRLVPLGSACVVLALGCGLVFKGAATALG